MIQLMLTSLKRILAPLLIIATLLMFWHYIDGHPEVGQTLRSLSSVVVIKIILLLTVTFAALAWVLRISLALFGKNLDRSESWLLNSYTTIINFFGPGQSGPAVRGAYLYKKHKMKVKEYLFATLLYYAIYATISLAMIFVPSLKPWQSIFAIILSAMTAVLLVRYLGHNNSSDTPKLSQPLKLIILLVIATAVQLTAQTIIYAIELKHVNPTISISQIATYTGTANMALFASITPGAIGIREAFLVFTQQIHSISTSDIVAANAIDRCVYLLFLGILAIFTLIFHAKEKFTVKTR